MVGAPSVELFSPFLSLLIPAYDTPRCSSRYPVFSFEKATLPSLSRDGPVWLLSQRPLLKTLHERFDPTGSCVPRTRILPLNHCPLSFIPTFFAALESGMPAGEALDARLKELIQPDTIVVDCTATDSISGRRTPHLLTLPLRVVVRQHDCIPLGRHSFVQECSRTPSASALVSSLPTRRSSQVHCPERVLLRTPWPVHSSQSPSPCLPSPRPPGRLRAVHGAQQPRAVQIRVFCGRGNVVCCLHAARRCCRRSDSVHSG